MSWDTLTTALWLSHPCYGHLFTCTGMHGLPAPGMTWLPAQVASMQGIAEKYRVTSEENRRLYNEVQDLKGNIRVFCRVRPAGATGDGSACKCSCLSMA